ncbi:MAG: hypothetical protein ACHQIK_08780 [Candidatus Acidiferrales bacterium]
MSEGLTYNDKAKTVVRIGDVVMAPGNMRGIVIGIQGTFVKILGIGTSKDSGDTFVLPQRYVHDFPVSDCSYMPKQILNLFPMKVILTQTDPTAAQFEKTTDTGNPGATIKPR